MDYLNYVSDNNLICTGMVEQELADTNETLSDQTCQNQAIQASKMKIEWGSQIRNYVMHPYKLVKDVRTGEETGNVDAVMDGEINPFLKAYLMMMGQKEEQE